MHRPVRDLIRAHTSKDLISLIVAHKYYRNKRKTIVSSSSLVFIKLYFLSRMVEFCWDLGAVTDVQ